METTCDGHRHTGPAEPSDWVVRFAPLVPEDGTMLDIACGGGRHGRHFLERGHQVTFVDRDISGVRDLEGRAGADIVEADLESPCGWPFGDRRFDAIVVTNYLWRPLLPILGAAIAKGGVLIYETFARGNEAFGRPRNPHHLLRPGELLDAFGDSLQVVAYENGIRRDHTPRAIQRITAVRREGPVSL